VLSVVARNDVHSNLAEVPGAPAADGDVNAPSSDSDALQTLEATFTRLLVNKTPQLYSRVEASLFAVAYRHSGQNQLETARLLGLSRHVVRARLLEQGALSSTQGRGQRASQPPPAGDSAPASARRVHAAPRPVLRLGYQRLGLFMWLKARGVLEAAFASRGVQIEWREFPGGIQMVDALATGALDVGGLGDCPAVFAQAREVPIVYLAAEPAAPRGTALVVPSGSQVTSVSDLRGRRIAVNRAAQAHYLLLRALEEANVDPSEIEIFFAPPERALQAFSSGAVDAWSIWDPWLANARLELGARTLRDSKGLMDNSVYYVARRGVVERQPELIELLVEQLELTARWAKEDPAGAAKLVAADLGFSPAALLASLDRELCLKPVTSLQLEAQQGVADMLWRLQLIPRAVSVADARWDMKLAG
jgi:sulfonate transport system substrate-binding protein